MFASIMSTFGESAIPQTIFLEPRLKPGQDAATLPPPPVSFRTFAGERRVPRNKDPSRPSFEMIKDARKGTLSGFLRSGKLIRASDLVGDVNPKTAIITLHNIYDFETRCLTAIDDQPIPSLPMSSAVTFKKSADTGAADEKTLRNLFYISLAQDELPSFHFWTREGDPNPMIAAERHDWGKEFDENPPSPKTAAKIVRLENERKARAKQGAEQQQSTQTHTQVGFLDSFNDNKNLPGLGREPIQGQSAGDINPVPQTSVSPAVAQSPPEVEVLLQFNRGGMYLREFTLKALHAMAFWMVENEEEEKEEDENEDEDEDPELESKSDMFLDILEPEKNLREEKIVSVSRASMRNFEENIKPLLSQPGNEFRVRSARYSSSLGFDQGGIGTSRLDLKLVRPNVGYCYCSSSWDNTKQLRQNSARFEKALQFLFDWKLSAHPKAAHLTLEIPSHGSFRLDRDSEVLFVLEAKIQKIFHQLSSAPCSPDSRPTEIFVRDYVEDDTDGSDSLDNSPPKHGKAKYEGGSGDVPDVHQRSRIPSDGPEQLKADTVGSSVIRQAEGRRSTQATEIRGGPHLPSIHPRLLTASETIALQERLRIAEAVVEDVDDLHKRLRAAEEKLTKMGGMEKRLSLSEDKSKLKFTCPFCPKDWAAATKQQQQDHLRLHQQSIVHQPVSQKCPQPNCTRLLGEGQEESTHEAIADHLRGHIEEAHAEDGICEFEKCHTNMYTLTEEQQEEHESIHREIDHREIERLEQALIQSSERISDLNGELLYAHEGQQQETNRLQEAINDRDRWRQDFIAMTGERDSLQARVSELEGHLEAAPGLDQGVQTEEAEREAVVDEVPKQPSQPKDPKKLRYCNVCLKSVDKLSDNAKAKHAEKCQTNVSELLLLNPAEAKAERERRNKGGEAVRPPAKEGTEEGAEVPETRKKRKPKAASSESGQDEVEEANTVQRPESSKASGRKTPKRKNDVYQPPKEVESEDEDPEPEPPKKTLKRKTDAFKPPKDVESEDEDLEPVKKKPKGKANVAKVDNETAPARTSARIKNKEHAPEEKEDDEQGEEQIEDEPSSSAKGGKKKRGAAAVTTDLKKKPRTKK